jgi:hypothetical protein
LASKTQLERQLGCWDYFDMEAEIKDYLEDYFEEMKEQDEHSRG